MKYLKKYGVAVFCFVATLLAIWFSYRELEKEVERRNTTEFTEVICLTPGAETSGIIAVTATVPQSWDDYDDEGHSCKGAQYDFTVTNHSEEYITNWKIVLHLPKGGDIDSFWSGEIFNEGTEITFVPGEESKNLVPGGTETFGFVMYSGVVRRFEEFTFSGYYEIHMEDMEEYGRIAYAFYAWCLLAAVYLVFEIMTFRAEKKRENDMRIIIETMETFSNFIDAKDAYTKGHSKRVSQYTKQMAKRFKYSKDDIIKIGYIALMHDCGKIGIPDSVLNKPGALTPEERKIIEEHTKVGGNILEHYTAIEGIKEGAIYHHERYDGQGYPEGLKGEEIPFIARMICVADSFDAMNSDRCYRKHLPKEVIISELEKNMGKQFDPDVAKCMIDLINEGVIPCADD